MEIGECECPYPGVTYVVTFERSNIGEVHFSGVVHYNPQSFKKDTTYFVNPESVRKLYQKFRTIKFMQLDTAYIKDPTFDMGWTNISIIGDGYQKTVGFNGNQPKLDSLEAMIIDVGRIKDMLKKLK
jgi:hypothetical protein